MCAAGLGGARGVEAVARRWLPGVGRLGLHAHHNYSFFFPPGWVCRLQAPVAMELLGTLQLSATGLDAKDKIAGSTMLGSGVSDPFFKVLVADSRGKQKTLYKSETIKKTLEPAWAPFSELSQVEMDAQLTIQVYDWDRFSSNDLIGQVTLPAGALRVVGAAFTLINPKKQRAHEYKRKGTGYTGSGQLTVVSCSGSGSTNQQQIDEIMASIDTDGDGEISFDEFRSAMLAGGGSSAKVGGKQRRVRGLGSSGPPQAKLPAARAGRSPVQCGMHRQAAKLNHGCQGCAALRPALPNRQRRASAPEHSSRILVLHPS